LTSFNDLGLAEPILRALADEQYTQPTPIQAQTIPYALAGRDIVGIAQTGTGKTAAFALPILNHLAANRARPDRKHCRVLVLSPTRELSSQIQDSFNTYGRHTRPAVTLAIGGVPIGRQQRSLAGGVDVLVATPGRLIDLVRMGAVRLDRVEYVVLDEADRMLDMGFIHDIRSIIKLLPTKRQSLFFSATMPREIEELASGFLRDPAKVAVTPVATTAERIAQRVIHVDRVGKQGLLAEVLRSEPVDRALVFTRTKHGADKVARGLVKAGIPAEAIHGNKSQNQRERVLAAFRSGSVRILIATDIAARGIDVEGISHVINYDLPNVPESYVHRIGRTARAGAEGIAISFCDGEERAYLRDIEKLIRQSIPATDRSGAPRSARPEGQRPEGQRQANGHHRPGRPHGQRQGQQHQQPQGEQRADGQKRKRRRRPQNGQVTNGQVAQAQRNEAPRQESRNEARGQNQQRGNGKRPQHREPGSDAHHDNIGAVAFLRRKPRPDAPAQP
jgi:ATP-dependent RNA helicase RhlE